MSDLFDLDGLLNNIKINSKSIQKKKKNYLRQISCNS